MAGGAGGEEHGSPPTGSPGPAALWSWEGCRCAGRRSHVLLISRPFPAEGAAAGFPHMPWPCGSTAPCCGVRRRPGKGSPGRLGSGRASCEGGEGGTLEPGGIFRGRQRCAGFGGAGQRAGLWDLGGHRHHGGARGCGGGRSMERKLVGGGKEGVGLQRHVGDSPGGWQEVWAWGRHRCRRVWEVLGPPPPLSSPSYSHISLRHSHRPHPTAVSPLPVQCPAVTCLASVSPSSLHTHVSCSRLCCRAACMPRPQKPPRTVC